MQTQKTQDIRSLLTSLVPPQMEMQLSAYKVFLDTVDLMEKSLAQLWAASGSKKKPPGKEAIKQAVLAKPKRVFVNPADAVSRTLMAIRTGKGWACKSTIMRDTKLCLNALNKALDELNADGKISSTLRTGNPLLRGSTWFNRGVNCYSVS